MNSYLKRGNISILLIYTIVLIFVVSEQDRLYVLPDIQKPEIQRYIVNSYVLPVYIEDIMSIKNLGEGKYIEIYFTGDVGQLLYIEEFTIGGHIGADLYPGEVYYFSSGDILKINRIRVNKAQPGVYRGKFIIYSVRDNKTIFSYPVSIEIIKDSFMKYFYYKHRNMADILENYPVSMHRAVYEYTRASEYAEAISDTDAARFMREKAIDILEREMSLPGYTNSTLKERIRDLELLIYLYNLNNRTGVQKLMRNLLRLYREARHPRYLMKIADVYRKLGDYRNMKQCYLSYISYLNRLAGYTIDYRDKAEIFYEIGEIYRILCDNMYRSFYVKAARSYEKYALSVPADDIIELGDIYYKIAMIYKELGDESNFNNYILKSLNYYLKVIDISSGDIAMEDFYISLVNIYIYLRNYERAKQLLETRITDIERKIDNKNLKLKVFDKNFQILNLINMTFPSVYLLNDNNLKQRLCAAGKRISEAMGYKEAEQLFLDCSDELRKLFISDGDKNKGCKFYMELMRIIIDERDFILSLYFNIPADVSIPDNIPEARFIFSDKLLEQQNHTKGYEIIRDIVKICNDTASKYISGSFWMMIRRENDTMIVCRYLPKGRAFIDNNIIYSFEIDKTPKKSVENLTGSVSRYTVNNEKAIDRLLQGLFYIFILGLVVITLFNRFLKKKEKTKFGISVDVISEDK